MASSRRRVIRRRVIREHDQRVCGPMLSSSSSRFVARARGLAAVLLAAVLVTSAAKEATAATAMSPFDARGPFEWGRGSPGTIALPACPSSTFCNPTCFVPLLLLSSSPTVVQVRYTEALLRRGKVTSTEATNCCSSRCVDLMLVMHSQFYSLSFWSSILTLTHPPQQASHQIHPGRQASVYSETEKNA